MRQQIHVDTGSLNKMITKNNGNPFDCTIRLGQTHRRLREIRLLNAQIPIGFYNLRSPYNVLTIDSNTHVIQEGNYDITNLLSNINSKIVTNFTGTFTVDNRIRKVTFTSAGSTANTIYTTTPLTNLQISSTGYFDPYTQQYIVQSGYPSNTFSTLSTFLGFTGNPRGTVLTATNQYNINFDNYIKIHIENLGTSSSEPDLCSFKIPLNNISNGSTLYWSENSENYQRVLVTDSTCIVDRLNIKVYDRFNNLLNNNGLDWSFTIEIESCT